MTTSNERDAEQFERLVGTVHDSGGGYITVLVDRDTDYYPREGQRVTVALVRQCPFYVFGQVRHPDAGGTLPPNRRLRCPGVEGHEGPHQVQDDAWLVDRG